MRLYLVQHGEALPESVDAARPLSERGRDDIRKLAVFLAEAGIRVGRVLHSGKRRASDTASLLIEAVGAGAAVDVVEKGLSPKDSPEHLVEAAGTWLDDTLVVGHEPFMSRFVSRLVLGREQPTIVDFTPGTIVCLARRPVTGAWCIAWMLVPEVLRG
jgi:phosphohistidine phosphatase